MSDLVSEAQNVSSDGLNACSAFFFGGQAQNNELNNSPKQIHYVFE